MSKIQIIATGGTLDKEYDPLTGELNFPQTHLPQIFEQALVTAPVEISPLMALDSLQMNDSDRQLIAKACIETSAHQIVVTHGTDTMAETGKMLIKLGESGEFDKLRGKTIILTGAMRPFALGNSDAAFNLGAALMAAQTAAPGVYICMNGLLHPADRVQKNRQLGVFEAQ